MFSLVVADVDGGLFNAFLTIMILEFELIVDGLGMTGRLCLIAVESGCIFISFLAYCTMLLTFKR